MSEIIRSIQHLSHDVGRMLMSVSSKELTASQAVVARYVEKGNRETGVLQLDVEKYFHIRRSSASAVIGALEKKGFIERRRDDSDSRMKRLFATKKLDGIKHHFDSRYLEIEAIASKGFSEQERDTLYELLERVKENLEVKNESQRTVK